MQKKANQLIEVFFDIETQRFFDDIDSKDPSLLGISLVSVYKRIINNSLEEREGTMYSYWEKELEQIWPLFEGVDRIIGFNSLKFDVPVLKPHAPSYFSRLPHFDILDQIKQITGQKIRLNSLTKHTLGREKSDTGKNAILYYQKGDPQSLAKLKQYCEDDVLLTRDLYDHALKHGQLKYIDHWNNIRSIKVDFSYPKIKEANPQKTLF